MNASAAPALIEAKVTKGGSSGRFKNPAVALYDPSGLRSTMSATWEALDLAVLKNADPNHLPAPAWYTNQESVDEFCEKKGIPYTLGRRFKPAQQSDNYNEVRW